MVIDATLSVLALVLALEGWSFIRMLRYALAPAEAWRPLDRYPSLTVVRPIKGIDAGAYGNLQAALDNGYPGPIETLFVFDHEREPALPLALDAIREHRANGGHGRARVLFCGEPPPGRTGKLNAMIVGLAQAEGELVAFADSDTRAPRGALTVLVETLRSCERAGAAFAPVVVTSPMRTLGDAAYALTLDGIYGGAVAVSALLARGELPFVMGQVMVFEREAIAAIGGLSRASGQLVDDMYLGARLHAAGYRNVVSPRSVPIVQQGLPFMEFARTYRRWLAFSISGLDLRFVLGCFRHGLIFWAALLVAIVALFTGSWLALALATAVLSAMAWTVADVHRRLGGAPLPFRFFWVPAALLIATPLFYPTIYARRLVGWRGRTYTIDRRGRLADSPVAQA